MLSLSVTRWSLWISIYLCGDNLFVNGYIYIYIYIYILNYSNKLILSFTSFYSTTHMKFNHSRSFRSRKMRVSIENSIAPLIAIWFSLDTQSSNICEYRVLGYLYTTRFLQIFSLVMVIILPVVDEIYIVSTVVHINLCLHWSQVPNGPINDKPVLAIRGVRASKLEEAGDWPCTQNTGRVYRRLEA